MPELDIDGRKVSLDEDGFLVNYGDWDAEVARAIAKKEGINLAPGMLEALQFMRDYYSRYKFFPIIRAVCKNVHQPRNCITENFVDPVTAWKLAGLPNLGEEMDIFKYGPPS